jgi:hypothetical protein
MLANVIQGFDYAIGARYFGKPGESVFAGNFEYHPQGKRSM